MTEREPERRWPVTVPRSPVSLRGGWSRWLLTAAVGAVALCTGARGEDSVHHANTPGAVAEWIVLGGFPNPEATGPTDDAAHGAGYARDYLEALGGEASAELVPGEEVAYGVGQVAAARVQRVNAAGVLDFLDAFPDGRQVAYAGFSLESASAQTLRVKIQANDSARVFAGARLRYETPRAPTPQPQEPPVPDFELEAGPGRTPVLVKVEDRGGRGWSLKFEIFDEAGWQAYLDAVERKAAMQAFQGLEPVPEDGHGFVRPPGALPELVWPDPGLVERLFGGVPLKTRWYRVRGRGDDVRFREVSRARRGLYLGVAQGTLADGQRLVRAATMYCVSRRWTVPKASLRGLVNRLPIPERNVEALQVPLSDRAFWRKRVAAMPAQAGIAFGDHLDAALLAAWAANDKPSKKSGSLDDPMVYEAELHLALRRMLEGGQVSPLAPPRVETGPAAPALRNGTAAEAGVAEAVPEALDTLCRTWFDASREPFVTLAARNGVVFFHAGYGAPRNKVFWMASLTKLITGVLFAQFMDQGLCDPDTPIGQYLPDFPVAGPQAITARQCFTHTTGLSGHGLWGGVYNPYLDNVIANGRICLQPGLVREYNGMGSNLAGKLMESAGGAGALRLMHERLFAPLGMTKTHIAHLGSISYSTAEDMARLGQLLLNRGAWGTTRLFGRESFEKLLPVDLHSYYPCIRDEWGLGMVYMRESFGPGMPFCGNVIGHGAASGAVLRVDLDYGLVVVQVRDRWAEGYEENLRRMLEIIAQGVAH